MSASEIVFRYFRNPHQFSTYSDTPKTCDICGQVRAGYGGPFYGKADVEFVCEECLATGRLAERDVITNEGDLVALREQLRGKHPKLDEAQIEARAQQRTTELENCTPHLITWEDFFWPAHCGDYCCFFKEVGKPDLNNLAPDGDGRTFFGTHLYGDLSDLTDVSVVWERIRPDSPKDNVISYTVGVYLFQCLHCGAYVILWDCE